MKQKFNVIGMTCSSCSSNVDKAVHKITGVDTVNVSLLSNSMVVEYDQNIVDDSMIMKAVDSAGYKAELPHASNSKGSAGMKEGSHEPEDELKEMKFRLIVSFAFLFPLMYISMGHMFNFPLPSVLHGNQNAITFAFTQLLLTLPIVYVNRKYFIVGFKTLFHGSPNMDSLIAIGSTAAAFYGVFAIYKIGYGLGHNQLHVVEHYSMDLYFESAAMILALITLGKYLETRSKGKTSEAISKLLDMAPKMATVIRDGQEITISVEDVVIDEVIIVKPGQSIPVDGIIIEGSSAIDQAAITGESIPVEKQVGDKVIGATINKTGSFKFQAKKVGDDTTLSQIIRLVEEASSSKAPIAKLADKISGVFVPVVIIIAVVATIVWLLMGQSFEFALSIGIAVLVISCPCALGLATPVAIMVGTGKGAEHGILIKSAEALEIAHTIDTVILDKTGTITEGKPKVTDIHPVGQLSRLELLRLAASIEKPSEHPLADAVVERSIREEQVLEQVDHFNAVLGQGIEATMGGQVYYAGNQAYMNLKKIDTTYVTSESDQYAREGKTPLFFAREDEFLGMIAVADVVKPTSLYAIQQFKKMGIEVVMLTGDNKKTANAIKDQLSIERVVAEVMPQDKEKEVRAIQDMGKKVAMIGDGINDAPALARADVGIAIGAGTDVAIESADIVLMKSDLLDAVTAIQLSKSVIRNIKQNLFWAFFYNVIGIPLAAGVFYGLLTWKLNPMFGAAAMSLSSVCVVSNALRLKLFKPSFKREEQSLPIMIESKLKKENTTMEKKVKIEGMTCGHCKANVEKALTSINGVTGAVVNLEEKTAIVTMIQNIEDKILLDTVNNAGYEAIAVE